MKTGRIHNVGTKNLTPTQKYGTHGYHRYLPLREYDGKNAQREHVGRAAWVDMHTEKSYPAGENWEKPPPTLPTGDAGREPRCAPPSAAYRANYARIFRHD